MPLKDKEALKKYNREYQRIYYAKMKQNKDITPNDDNEQGTQTDPIPKTVKVIRPKPKASVEIETQTGESSRNEATPDKQREEYILNFYSTIKTEYNFMMWVRNIKRVHKALFNQETIQNERSEIKKQPADNSLIDCIRSLLKVGERYISLHSSPTNLNGVPIFFHIKQIEDEKILITYVNIRFLKCGDGKAMFIPEWENIIGDIVIYNKDLFNVRPFKERECYKNDSYLEIKKSVNEFYRIVKVRY